MGKEAKNERSLPLVFLGSRRRDTLQAEPIKLPSSSLKSGRGSSFSFTPRNYDSNIQEIAQPKPIENFRNNLTTTKKTSLGKRKKSEQNPDTLDNDSVIMSEPRKKIQKVSHSNTTERKSIEKMKSKLILSEPSFACSCGAYHTITLSDDGTAHSFGRNTEGQLGLGHNNDVSLPTPIPNLPKINMISCGAFFSVCTDYEGFIWSFGANDCGQLGTGNTTTFNVPQKIQNIPPVLSVFCGYSHTLIITNDSNLWSCGRNDFGQLCHGDKEYRLKPQKTSFSHILKISAGWYHSLFQNDKGEILSCGNNEKGVCGLGHFNPQITPSLIPNAPSHIVQFVCGYNQNLFLDSEGNVFSVGNNEYGELGLGHNRTQNELNKIPNIPPIKIISCVLASCYLIDFEGNLWSFGCNSEGQLGHGYKTNINTPKIVNTLIDIQQISYGCCGGHFFTKNSQNQIFIAGRNDYGQLGKGDTRSVSLPKEINSQYSTIWGSEFYTRSKSARICSETTTMMNWKEEEIKKIERMQSKIKQVKINLESNNNNKIKQEFPQNSFESWNEVHYFLNAKSKQINSKLKEKQNIELQIEKDIQSYEMELKDIEHQVQQLQSRKKEIEENLLPKAKQSQESFKQTEKNQKLLQEMCFDVSTFCKNENEMNEELFQLFKQKRLEEFDCSEISKCLWKMDLTKYQSLFELNQINGAVVSAIDDDRFWKQLGVEKRDCFYILFNFEMMKAPGYSKTFSPDYFHNCCVCSHNTPEKTIHLLKEYEIPIEDDFILKNNYTAPMLISKVFLEDLLGKDSFSQKGIQIMVELEKWKKLHKIHLADLA